MLDISIRINAVIAYLFLGPILLFAKKNTPLADPYVRGHAKRASIIIVIGICTYMVYVFLKDYLTFQIFSIALNTIILTVIVSSILISLIQGAYYAFRGYPAEDISWKSLHLPENSTSEGIYQEEDKVRIMASFIPFIGIIIAKKYPKTETIIGRKLSSLIIFIILTSSVFFGGANSILTIFIIIIYIGLITTTSVYLFGFSRFLNFRFYDSIPTYLEFDALIKAGFMTILDFFRIAFGGEKKSYFIERYSKYLEKNKVVQGSSLQYFAPNWIFAIPLVNIITLPSFWKINYREYIPLILQGFLLTILTCLLIYIGGTHSQLGLYLLFPIMTLLIESNNLLVRAPFTSIAVDLYFLFTSSQSMLHEITENGEQKISYTYEVGEEIK